MGGAKPPMTIDDAITHAMDVYNKASCEKCKLDHMQLAKWLEELKQLRWMYSELCK